jgi:serine/threonine protein kinase
MPEREPQIDPLTRRASARIGQVLRGKWRIDRLLGVGGMAAVYEGTHRNGKRGAIKLLHPEVSTDTDARRRFLQEGYAANRVEHPGAVSVLDDDVTEDGSVFLVMELLEGQAVSDLAEDRPDHRLDLATTVRIADQALDVLASAHERGIVHRDVKPENLFLTRDGAIKVVDFGLARVEEHQSGVSATRTGNTMGTPAFMAPEQALGNWSEVDARTDLWAIGATMFSLLTGRLVHQATNVQQMLLAAMTKPAPPLRSVQPEIPVGIADVVDRALAFDRDARWPSARAMQGALRKAGQAIAGLAPAAPIAALAPIAPIAALAPITSSGTSPVRGASSPSLLGATMAVTPAVRARRGRIASIVAAMGLALAAAIMIGLFFPWARPIGSTSVDAARSAGPTATAVSATAPGSATAPVIEAAPEPTASATSPASAKPAPAPPVSASAPAGTAKKPGAPAPGKPDPFEGWQ